MYRRKKRGALPARGFSLLELVAALLVFSLGMLLLVNLFPVSYTHLGRSREITSAAFLCQGKMDEVLAEPYADPAPADGTFPENPRYGWQVEKRPFSANLKQVITRVFDHLGPRPVLAAEYSTLQGAPLLGDFVVVPYANEMSQTYLETLIYYETTSGTFKCATRLQGGVPPPFPVTEIEVMTTGRPLRVPLGGSAAAIRAYPLRRDLTPGPYRSNIVLFAYDTRNNCIWRQTLNVYSNGEMDALDEMVKYADIR